MMLSIGEFARETGLSAKALRLYDELELVTPAEVDDRTGYRRYTADQVDHARLVARLRVAGVPLRTIAAVAGATTPEVAAAELLSYWRQVEADTASARSIVASLLAQMRGRHAMTDTTETTTRIPRSAHRAGRGARDAQLDEVHPRTHRLAAQVAGQRLFAVADGFGDADGAAGVALDALAALDAAPAGPDPLGALDAAVRTAADAVARRADDGAPGSGTTLTALLLVGDRALVAHVGDSRAYAVGGEGLVRLTHDHTVVQSMLDQGRLRPEEAGDQPSPAVLNRALGHGTPTAPDLSVRPVAPGERLVLTTDGVHAVLEPRLLAELLTAPGEPDEVAASVEAAVLAAGAPDNYAVVVVEV
ncbi:MerR family transcriptional regulator [Nocardioides sp. zg-1228]|uniref:MerR family transcriptional regulator n=1 Tax=Nocardioides sp. zg-1228 TaxID=2763008 RepID=UPI0016434F85|nr:MerR family transcriptional regulator [Nocardioides sp. zg-1228]MBC2933167.1 MerR family transcriptional regulator [Nocardioides sp. zg-1228]QSF56654.1 MerR family transcriptional regulator [Nocardioides sp. zg-1228]